jgi:hypothetical protein
VASRTDYGTTVLSYVLPDNREGLDYALERLSIEHFRDGVQRTFWKVLSTFAERYGDVFPAQHLLDLLTRNGIPEAQVLLYSETYDLYAQAHPAESAFRFAVDGLRDDRDHAETGEAITTAFEILEEGAEVDGVVLQGHAAAREYFTSRMSVIEERSVVEDAPEGDLRSEHDRLITLYTERESREDTPGVLFGIDSLDTATNGVQPGELALLAAYTNEGKSQLLAQLAWDACVNQGKAVFFATSETVRDTTMRRILSRHSRLPKFGYPQGLNAKAIQNGTLSPEQREIYFEVVRDFTTNPDIAMCHISQLPRGATLDFLDARVTRVNRQHPGRPDLHRLPPAPQGQDQARLRARGVQRDSARDQGHGPRLRPGPRGRGGQPWQIRQTDYKTALTTNGYTLASLADTSEAEKTPT